MSSSVQGGSLAGQAEEPRTRRNRPILCDRVGTTQLSRMRRDSSVNSVDSGRKVKVRQGRTASVAAASVEIPPTSSWGEMEKVWGSMVKQTLKRRKPGFNESYHGFNNFSQLLEEAQAAKLLVLEPDEKSGGYVIKSVVADE